MNLRHAAVLALVGWYLMVPPALSHGPKDGQIEPLPYWSMAGAFEVEKDCDAERLRLSKFNPNLGSYRGLPPEEIYDVQCVATDDPRLKEK